MNYFVGIDNSSTSHFVTIIDEFGKFVKSIIIENTFRGFTQLHEILAEWKDVKIGFEIPHGPIVDFLNSKKYDLYNLNPLKVKRFKEALCVSGDKSDKIDAKALAEYLLRNHKQIKSLIFSSDDVETLNIFRISHSRLTREKARYKNKLTFLVRQYFPLLDGLFSRLTPPIMLKMLIKYKNWGNLKQASDDEIKIFLKANHYRATKHIDKIINKIRGYEQIISSPVEYALGFEAIAIANILLSIESELKMIEAQMNSIVDNHSMGIVFTSLPGAGQILSAKLLALFGDNKLRFHRPDEVRSLFGTAPKNYQSGSYHKVLMRKACNKPARAILYQFAFSSMRFAPWAKDYYKKQREKNKTHSVAVRALSNVWLKIIFSMWKNNAQYQPDKIISKAA